MKKAQINLGWLFITFIGIIVAFAFLTPISNTVSLTTNTQTINNRSFTASTTDVAITGYQQVQGTYTLTNSSGGTLAATNATLVASSSSGGLQLYLHIGDPYLNAKVINVSGTLEPIGYAEDSGSRGIIPLIVIVSTLAILAFAIPNLREYFNI
jgi:hypothetical protein